MDYSKITLGELLSSENQTIKRNAISILKQLQKKPKRQVLCNNCHKPLTQKELNRYPIQWQFSGDMYCQNCIKENLLESEV